MSWKDKSGWLALCFVLFASDAVQAAETPARPLETDEIADLPPPVPGTLAPELIERRLRNLHLMDYTVRKCEYRKHLTGYQPLVAHVMYEWEGGPKVNARHAVPCAAIDQYARWGVQIIEFHSETWAHFGRLEPVDEAVFTRTIDYCHRQGIKVYVYVTGIFSSLADPEQEAGQYVLPLYGVRDPATYDPDKARAGVAKPWVWGCPGSPAWHHYLLSGIERLFTRYKVDGLYFDSGIGLAIRCRHYSDVYGTRHYERLLDRLNRGGDRPLAEQGPAALVDYEVDLINQIGGLCQRYHKGLTVYMNTPTRFGNYEMPNPAITQRLAGEAGNTRSLAYWMDINRHVPGATAESLGLFEADNAPLTRAMYYVYAWWNRNTMPAEEPFYACNVPFIQFPYLMQGLVTKGSFTPEWERLWAHYGRIYRAMAAEDAVAYVNVRDARIFRRPLDRERLVSSFFVREDVYVVLANLTDEDAEVELTIPLENVETGQRDVRRVELPAHGALRIFKVQSADDLEPPPEADPFKAALEAIERRNVILDRSNLALEGRVTTSSLFQGPFGRAGGYRADTRATDGDLQTFWFQDFAAEPPPKDGQWFYLVELRQRGPLAKVQVVTRPEDREKLQVLLADDDWQRFRTPQGMETHSCQHGGKLYLTYRFPPQAARYLKIAGQPQGLEVRIFEIRAYAQADTPILDETGQDRIPRLASEVDELDIPDARNRARGCRVWLNYPCEAGKIVDGDLATGATAKDIWSGGGPLWCVLDLGKRAPVDAVQYLSGPSIMYDKRARDEIGQDGRVAWREVDQPQYQQYEIFLSVDLQNWTLVADETSNRQPPGPTGRTYHFAPRPARYVAVRVNHTSLGKGLPMQIREIKVR